MGLFTRAVMGRWIARWLMRGSPMAIVAKLAAVAALGAWRYHRQRKRAGESDQKRIDAEYEVLGPDRIAPATRPHGEPLDAAEGTPFQEVGEDPRDLRSIPDKEAKE